MQRGFTDNLQVWHKAMNLAKGVYLYCRVLPVEERFGLCDQMRRAAVSFPSNMAEGHKEFLRFLSIAHGSLSELKTPLLLCEELFPDKSSEAHALVGLAIEVDKMMNGLKKIGNIRSCCVR